MKQGWRIVPQGDINHVIPVDDDGMHQIENCSCNPRWDDGVMVHNSFDGREAFERGERQVS